MTFPEGDPGGHIHPPRAQDERHAHRRQQGARVAGVAHQAGGRRDAPPSPSTLDIERYGVAGLPIAIACHAFAMRSLGSQDVVRFVFTRSPAAR
jgi:hypothetical protein